MFDTTKQVEEILRPVGHWCAREEEYKFRPNHRRMRLRLHTQQLQTVIGSLACILDEVRLIQDHAGPIDSMEPVGMFAKDVVIDNDPTWVIRDLLIDAEHFYFSQGVDQLDLALPVQLDGGGAYHQNLAVRHTCFHRNYGLARFAKPHVIGKDDAFLGKQKGDTIRLMRIQATLRYPVETGCELCNFVHESFLSLVRWRDAGGTI